MLSRPGSSASDSATVRRSGASASRPGTAAGVSFVGGSPRPGTSGCGGGGGGGPPLRSPSRASLFRAASSYAQDPDGLSISRRRRQVDDGPQVAGPPGGGDGAQKQHGGRGRGRGGRGVVVRGRADGGRRRAGGAAAVGGAASAGRAGGGGGAAAGRAGGAAARGGSCGAPGACESLAAGLPNAGLLGCWAAERFLAS